MLALKLLLGFLQTQGSHPCKSCLARRKRFRGNDLGCRRLFGEEHSYHMSENLSLQIYALCIELQSHLM